MDIQGQNKIQIKYDGTSICLYINGELNTILVAGPYQDMTNDFYIHLKANDVTFDEIDPVELPIQSFDTAPEQFLQRFESGSYVMHPIQTDGKTFIHYQTQGSNEAHLFTGQAHDYEHIIVCTISLNELNVERINTYKEQIINGEKPGVYLYCKLYEGAELESYYFIIHGNHILRAYEELNISPSYLAIVNQSSCGYDETSQEVLMIISSFEEIRTTSYKYFYQ